MAAARYYLTILPSVELNFAYLHYEVLRNLAANFGYLLLFPVRCPAIVKYTVVMDTPWAVRHHIKECSWAPPLPMRASLDSFARIVIGLAYLNVGTKDAFAIALNLGRITTGALQANVATNNAPHYHGEPCDLGCNHVSHSADPVTHR